jgi:hypothetical protein
MRQVAGAETAIPHGRGGLLPQKSSVILGTQATIWLSMAIDWSVVTSEHREAARQLDVVKLRGRSYPAKFIRGLAMKLRLAED